MNRHLPSLLAGLAAFALDRVHKALQVSADCLGAASSVCLDYFNSTAAPAASGWRGGEILPVTPFFNYVLVWNTGVSYGLLGDLPVWALGLVAVIAIVALGIWWWRTADKLVRFGLMLVIGGASRTPSTGCSMAPLPISFTFTGRIGASTSSTWPTSRSRQGCCC